MNTLRTLILGMVLLVIAQSCKRTSGTGPIISEERKLSGFNAIASELSGDVYITQGSSYSLVLEGQQNILDIIETDVSTDGRLHIKIKNGVLISAKDLKVSITMPDISGLYLSGSGNMEVLNDFETPNLEIEVKGSGNVNLQNIIASSLRAKIRTFNLYF